MSEKVMCGYTTTQDFSWGEKIKVSFKKSELELMAKYLSGGNDKYEDSVSIQLLSSKAGKLYSSIDTYFYDKANGGTSGRGNGVQNTPIAVPAPPDEADNAPF
jgi:hypothetical protein